MKPEPIVPASELRRVALETMRAAKFPMFASLDGDQPRLRPVSPVKTEEFTVFVASMRSSGKTGELERISKVELCYLNDGHDQVRITGVAELVTHLRVSQDIWDENPLSFSTGYSRGASASCANGRWNTRKSRLTRRNHQR